MKNSIVYKIISYIVLVMLLISLGFLIYNMSLLGKIETFYRVMVSLVLTLISITLGYSLIEGAKHNKVKKIIISSVISLVISVILFIVSSLIYKAYKELDSMNKDELTYTTIMLSKSEVKLDLINGKKIGVVNDKEDISNYILPMEVIDKNNLKVNNEIVEYSDLVTLMNALINDEVDFIFISNDYKAKFALVEGYTEDTKLYEITVYKKNYQKAHVEKETISDKTEVTKPFTILLLGIDSEGQGIKEASSFNGDTIMLVSFDPVTLNATIFSIPRDTYVKMACGGRLNKINAASWGGTSCMVKTVQDLTGINVDYYAKINFKGVVDLVNVLGGVTVNVPISFCEQNSNREFGDALICLEPGVQKLDGEQALAFARHRHSLPLGDFQRAQHQQMIVEAMIQSMKSVRSVNDFYSILNAISNNIDTNMSTNEMLSFYNVAKNLLIKSGDVNLNITKTYLTGYDLYVYNGSGKAYTFQYYKQSLADIVKAMNITLGKEKKEEIKDFTFDLNEPYEKKVIGKTYYNETRKQVVPDFTLMSVSEAKSWGNNNGITINVNETTSESEEYTDGQITSQSVHDGVLTEEVSSSITVTVIKKISQSEDINNNTSEEETE